MAVLTWLTQLAAPRRPQQAENEEAEEERADVDEAHLALRQVLHPSPSHLLRGTRANLEINWTVQRIEAGLCALDAGGCAHSGTPGDKQLHGHPYTPADDEADDAASEEDCACDMRVLRGTK